MITIQRGRRASRGSFVEIGIELSSVKKGAGAGAASENRIKLTAFNSFVSDGKIHSCIEVKQDLLRISGTKRFGQLFYKRDFELLESENDMMFSKYQDIILDTYGFQSGEMNDSQKTVAVKNIRECLRKGWSPTNGACKAEPRKNDCGNVNEKSTQAWSLYWESGFLIEAVHNALVKRQGYTTEIHHKDGIQDVNGGYVDPNVSKSYSGMQFDPSFGTRRSNSHFEDDSCVPGSKYPTRTTILNER
jgi:hypothetical protein